MIVARVTEVGCSEHTGSLKAFVGGACLWRRAESGEVDEGLDQIETRLGLSDSVPLQDTYPLLWEKYITELRAHVDCYRN